jgi:hypothetical protein
MKPHECLKEEELGAIKEFIVSTKGLKVLLSSLVGAMILQVGTFLFLWGVITTTVTKNTEQLWKVITPQLMDNTRNIDKILEKMTVIKMIAVVGDAGPIGPAGVQGIQGPRGLPGKDR